MLLTLLLLVHQALAHDTSSTTDTSDSMMMSALHFTRGDTLWFASWVPESKGALAAACIGLFFLAVADRWLAACRALLEAQWALRTRRASAKPKTRLHAPPFIPAHDIARGALHALQAFFGFAFMLAVMTFQAAFIISIVVGFGVGEMIFGRYASAAGAAH
ncbi:copper transporter [Mycena vulgaris]|nr:copper transporter [Mycena vulgaris]